MVTRHWVQRILWIDGLAALTAGVFALLFRGLLAARYALPVDLITVIGIVNVSYSTLGLTLAIRKRRRVGFIVALSIANVLWACVCALLVVRVWNQASLHGLAHILFEGVFVAVLATIEWRNRHSLAEPHVSSSVLETRLDP